jgi:hypothetical protein
MDATDSIVVSDGRTTTIVVSGDTVSVVTPFPAINNRGTVVFSAGLQAGGTAILIGDGEDVTIVADTNGPFAEFDAGGSRVVNGPAINDSGGIAFVAHLDDGRMGIFTGPDVGADRVIVTGDYLFGVEVARIQFRREGLNNSGQIAFHATFSDGTSGIYRADPVGSSGKEVDR